MGFDVYGIRGSRLYNTVAFRVFEPNPGTCFNEASDADAVAAVALI